MEWISVKDRLPEHHMDVLTCSKLGYVSIEFYEYSLEEDGESRAYFSGNGDWVTHWMPLPKTPKKDENENNRTR